ncbi:MAG: PAC2 family protein [Natronomonas sp.]
MSPSPTFDVRHDESTETLVIGVAQYGLAGLTAVDYLTERTEMERVGHVAADGLPPVAPFEAGTPRHHTRLFADASVGMTVLVGELFVPPPAAGVFSEAIFDSMGEECEEIVVLSGVPTAHGPDDHRAFYIATEEFQRRRLEDTDIRAMGGGFLDGINGSIVSRAIDGDTAACVLTTPVHAQTPDVDAALRLFEALDEIYELDVDTGPLEEFAAAVADHYSGLAERVAEEQGSAGEDLMYM